MTRSTFDLQCDGICSLHLQEEVKALKEHPVEAGEVEEVGEGEGGAEEGLGELGGDQVLPGEGEDPVERRQAEGAEQPHVDLVTQASHLPEQKSDVHRFGPADAFAKVVCCIQLRSM